MGGRFLPEEALFIRLPGTLSTLSLPFLFYVTVMEKGSYLTRYIHQRFYIHLLIDVSHEVTTWNGISIPQSVMALLLFDTGK